jgi:GNAT superfamily N-acetyltransferase
VSEQRIEILPEDYDSDLAQQLVQALAKDIDERYAADPDDADHDLLHQLHVTAIELRPPDGAFLVAWLEDRAVGCGAVRRIDASGGEVKRMYTVPEARRRGVSRAVLRALEDEARRLGYRWLRLETGLRQHEAVALYHSAGWQPTEPYGPYQRSPLSVYLAKALHPA